MNRMSDLISRKAIIGYLKEQRNNVIIEKHKGGFVSEDVCRGMESAIDAFRHFISALPTAFDKEKVIEELVELRQREYNDSDEEPETIDGEEIYDEGRSQGRFEAYHRTIEIVEKGGIE